MGGLLAAWNTVSASPCVGVLTSWNTDLMVYSVSLPMCGGSDPMEYSVSLPMCGGSDPMEYWPHGIQCQPPHVWGFWPHGIQCGTYWGRALIGSLILGVSKMPEMNGHPVSALHLNNFCGCWYWLWRLFEPNSGPHIRGHNYTVFRKKWMKISDKIANKMLILTS